MLLGGLVAGGIGYGAHLYQTSQQAAPTDALDALSAELSELRAAMAQEADLTALEAQIAALEPAQMPDASAIEASIEELRAQIAAIPAPVDISGLQAQIDDLTAQDPVDLGPIRDSLAALEAAYAPVPEQIAALQADMEDLRALATQEVVEAEAAVDAALASAGLDRIRAAFVTGAGICRRGGAVGAGRFLSRCQMRFRTPPQGSGGCQRSKTCIEGFGCPRGDALVLPPSAPACNRPRPNLPRKSWAISFAAQIGARSLAPREGDDPDAIVARAGGCGVRKGDLAQARDELASLPEAGRAAMFRLAGGCRNPVECRCRNRCGAGRNHGGLEENNMFWTLLKLLVFVVAVIALAYGAGALMDSGQTVRSAHSGHGIHAWPGAGRLSLLGRISCRTLVGAQGAVAVAGLVAVHEWR